MDFTINENPDGSFEVYNTKIGDIYFSNVGAYKEAFEKFAQPATKIILEKDTINILDVCYGMGYNSKTFVDYVMKINPNKNINIDAIEIDKNILALGLFIFDKNIDKDIHLFFGKHLLSDLNFEKNMQNILGENWIKYFLPKILPFFNQKYHSGDIFLYSDLKLLACLHNIYYQNQVNFENKIVFHIFLENLLDILPEIHSSYDLIFHDAFSIKKQPELWTENVMKEYYRLLSPNGMMLTYSNSRVLRRILEKIGFEVKINYSPNEKQNGTIATKI